MRPEAQALRVHPENQGAPTACWSPGGGPQREGRAAASCIARETWSAEAAIDRSRASGLRRSAGEEMKASTEPLWATSRHSTPASRSGAVRSMLSPQACRQLVPASTLFSLSLPPLLSLLPRINLRLATTTAFSCNQLHTKVVLPAEALRRHDI